MFYYIIFLSLLSAVNGYKIALFVPDISNSQLLYNARVGETLAEAGHDVTLILIRATEGRDQDKGVKTSEKLKIKIVNGSTGSDKEEMDRLHSNLIFQDLSFWDSRQKAQINKFMEIMLGSCDVVLQNKEFLEWLKAEKFDLAFAHRYSTCPIGLIHMAKIPTWIWLNSGPLMDYVASLIGVTTVPSYVPPVIMESSDRMDIVERTKSFVGHIIVNIMWPRMIPSKETAMFRKHISPDFPDILDIARKCPLVMVNSNELYEFPRPTLAKVVNIGGLGVEFKNAKPLSEEFAKIADKGDGMIIMSFGSVAAAHMMPQHWKESFIGAFRRFPQYQFIIRYEGSDLNDLIPPNVHLSKWLPQADLLKHPKTRAFISHGGYNSLQEVITAGVPLITVALFGDQPKNAKLAEAHGFSFNIVKSSMSEEVVYNAINKLLQNPKYTEKVKRLSQMVQRKPVSPEHLLVKWTEFLAEFQTLENLVPAGQHLNAFQYYSLDVISLILIQVIFIIYIIVKVVILIVRCIFCQSRKQKND